MRVADGKRGEEEEEAGEKEEAELGRLSHLFPSLMPLSAVVPSRLTNRRRLLSAIDKTHKLSEWAANTDDETCGSLVVIGIQSPYLALSQYLVSFA